MKMPVVNQCQAEACAYNHERVCHALAITVGDAPAQAHCDTFFTASAKGGDPGTVGRVGACKVADCRHNTQFECRAPGIEIGYVSDRADCVTYAPA